MSTSTKHTPLMVVDPCPNCNGFSTIRPADGSEHGDTSTQPIATVYDPERAAQIVRAVNAYPALVGICKRLLARVERLAENSNCLTREMLGSEIKDARAALAGEEFGKGEEVKS